MKKTILKVISWTIVVVFLMVALYFSFKTKGDVATMVAGLWSALATVVLGLIALNQSRQYKKLSDKATKDYRDLQIEIKNLTSSMDEAINTLKKIEKAKYYPNLEEWRHYMFGINRDSYSEIMEDSSYTAQFNYLNVSQKELHRDFVDIIDNYNIFAFYLKNIGEKTIRNFNCERISFPGIMDKGYSVFYKSCDIKPGQIVIIFLINIPEFSSLEGVNVNMNFKMENLIGEHYVCQSDIIFYNNDDMPDAIVDFLNPVIEDN